MRTIALALVPSLAAAAPTTLVHQGRLLDATGAVVDGEVNLAIALWRHPTSTSEPDRAYVEPFTGVDVTSGYYALTLGAGGGLDSGLFDVPLWVEVTVAGQALSPRAPLAEVPRAATVAGLDLAVFDGVQRPCASGGHEVFDGSTGAWSGCPATWSCATDPGHAGCVSGSAYPTCLAIHDAPGFVGASGHYFIDPDGAGTMPPFSVWCDMEHDGGGWTRLATFEATTEAALSHEQAQAIPFREARLAQNGTLPLVTISCYATPTANGLQTTNIDRRCSATPWFIRFNIQNTTTAFAQRGNFGFYRGSLSTNNGGCSWNTTDGTVEVWGRHWNGSSACTNYGRGEISQSGSGWGSSSLWMYVR
jgi:hypothetical protein